MTDSADLVQRLRAPHVGTPEHLASYLDELCQEAADEIRRLKKELAQTQGHLAMRNSDFQDEQLRHAETAARALSIEAETREACARIAEGDSASFDFTNAWDEMRDTEAGAMSARKEIATAIRAGGK